MQLYDISGFKLPEEDICHHGIKGQKWGVRRYQNPDGSLTDLGKKRYLRNGQLTEKGKKKLDTDKYDNYMKGAPIKERLKSKLPGVTFNGNDASYKKDGIKFFNWDVDSNDFDEGTFLNICKNPTRYKNAGIDAIRKRLETDDSIRDWWDDGANSVSDVINNLENPEIVVWGKDRYDVTFLSKDFGYHWLTAEMQGDKIIGDILIEG